jgi:uncharacterized membrane protein
MPVAIVLSSSLSALVLVIAVVLPAINNPTVPFGVRVPTEHADDPVVHTQTRIYRRRMLLIGIVTIVVGAAVGGIAGETLLPPLSLLVLVGLWYCCFVAAHHEIRAAKTAGGWYDGVRQGVAVDTALRTDPPRFPWLWLAPALIVVAATVVIGVLQYPSMPEILAVHYGANGRPNRLAAKSIGTAFSMVLVQIGVTALLAGIAAAMFWGSRPDIDPAHPVSSARWHRRYMSLGAKALLGLVAMINVGMLGSSLLMWTGTVTRWAPLVIVVPILTAVAIAVVVLARNNRARSDGEVDTGLTHRDDDKHWRGGLFYVNRDDHALLVARRFGLGWTVNFGNPWTATILAIVVVAIGLLIALRLGA